MIKWQTIIVYNAWLWKAPFLWRVCQNWAAPLGFFVRGRCLSFPQAPNRKRQGILVVAGRIKPPFQACYALSYGRYKRSLSSLRRWNNGNTHFLWLRSAPSPVRNRGISEIHWTDKVPLLWGLCACPACSLSAGSAIFNGEKPAGVIFGESDRVDVGTWKKYFVKYFAAVLPTRKSMWHWWICGVESLAGRGFFYPGSQTECAARLRLPTTCILKRIMIQRRFFGF